MPEHIGYDYLATPPPKYGPPFPRVCTRTEPCDNCADREACEALYRRADEHERNSDA